MKRRPGPLARWWRFVRLTRSQQELSLPTTHSTRAARQQAVWELVTRARGFRAALRRNPCPN